MTILFLVDVENECQNFLKCDATSYDPSRYDRKFSVVAFFQKGTETTNLTKSFTSDILSINEAVTNSPEAADLSLVIYAAELMQNANSWDHPTKKFSKIYLVKGGEKGYGELIARLNKCFAGKFDEIDGRTSNICDYVPDIACGYCKKVFNDKYACGTHCRTQKCSCCDVLFKCSVEVTARNEVHNRQFIICREVGCTYRFCKPNGELTDTTNAHLKSHPKCTDKSVCGCDKHFLSADALTRHLAEIRQMKYIGDNTYVCDCKNRFPTLAALKAHCKAENHGCSCQHCGVGLNPKNYDKHKGVCAWQQ